MAVRHGHRAGQIQWGAKLPVTWQADLLGLRRSSVYYASRPLPERGLVLMRRLDELHLRWPLYGSRKLVVELRKDGFDVGRRHVGTLMHRRGIEVLYRKPTTRLAARGASIYPYLLG